MEYTENSFLLIDKNKKVVFFKHSPAQEIDFLLSGLPVTGQPILSSISINYRNDFAQILNLCLNGHSVTLREETSHLLTEKPFFIEITSSPVYIEKQLTYIVCTFGAVNVAPYIQKEFDDYTKFTSHELRAPITNILSLSNMENYPESEKQDLQQSRLILSEIYQQAEKIDRIILVLNDLINTDEENKNIGIPRPLEGMTTKMENKHILLIDDEPIVNRLHYMLLNKYKNNRTIVAFADPAKALEYIFKNKPDLIFLDLNMPKINGWEFLKLIEQHTIKVNVIIVSSSVDEREKIKARAYPFVKDFLSKPLTSAKISSILAP